MTLLYTEAARLLTQVLEARDAERLSALIASRPDYFARASANAMARFSAHDDIVALEMLAGRGAQVDALTPDGETALCAAARAGAMGATHWLLARGADLELRKDERRNETPLIAAVCAGRRKIVEALVARGANVAATFGDPPRNALDCALSNSDAALAEILRQAGARESVAAPTPEWIIDRLQDEVVANNLDLTRDASALRAFFLDAGARFNHGGKGQASNAHVLFSLESGFVDISFVAGRVVNPFAARLSPALKRVADLPHWRRYYELLDREQTTLTTMTGKKIETRPPPPETPEPCADIAQLRKAIGEAIVDVVMPVDGQGPFATLNKAPGCQFSIQDDEDWNWPDERALGQSNLL